ncbi:MAG TPA: hypothetical protein VEY95_05705 [Azospirillaceae bacterium]|nr:hypothetical protein [Azospirillaceae bacterium]
MTHNTPRGSSLITLASGIRINPADPDPHLLSIGDIARAMANTCRFNGHCRRFYSVAEHSVHVAALVAPRHRSWALLHDAAEVFLSDVPLPAKPLLTGYARMEEKVPAAITRRFGLVGPMPDAVKTADREMLRLKLALLLGNSAADPRTLKRLSLPRLGLPPAQAKRAFLSAFAGTAP